MSFRYLLRFGKVSYYLGYNALEDFFPTMIVRPNPQCSDSWCKKRQAEYNAKKSQNDACKKDEPEPKKEEIVHEDNEWGMFKKFLYILWLVILYLISEIRYKFFMTAI